MMPNLHSLHQLLLVKLITNKEIIEFNRQINIGIIFLVHTMHCSLCTWSQDWHCSRCPGWCTVSLE